MKGFTIFIVLAIVVIVGFLAFRKPATAPVSEETNSSETASGVNEDTNGIKEFDTTASSAKWTGSKTLIKDYYDNGTVAIKSGNALFTKGVLTGGEVVFDMTTITATSTGKGDGEDMLSGHLKSEDFFDSTKYPEAKFVITSVIKQSDTNYMVTGDLTVKDKTAPVTFPATVSTTGEIVTISGTATVDRTVYDVRFGSSKFFEDLGDKVVNDEFKLEFKAVAN